MSVKSFEEATLVAKCDVGILDLKEPARGALGACDPLVWRNCIENIPYAGKWSVALGESETAVAYAADVPPDVHFAKADPVNHCTEQSLQQLWSAIRDRLPVATALVAVAYADFSDARSLSPEATLELARHEGLHTLLIDTYRKQGQTSIDCLGFARLQKITALSRSYQIDVVLAGSLSHRDSSLLTQLPVQRIGVRGCVCRGGRNGGIDPNLVNQLRALLDGSAKRVVTE